MPVLVQQNGTWKKTNQYVQVNSNWKKLINTWVNKDNTWKKTYSYTWVCGPWSDCSVTCGGGTQTRSVTCQRSDGFTVEDIYCENFSETTTQGC